MSHPANLGIRKGSGSVLRTGSGSGDGLALLDVSSKAWVERTRVASPRVRGDGDDDTPTRRVTDVRSAVFQSYSSGSGEQGYSMKPKNRQKQKSPHKRGRQRKEMLHNQTPLPARAVQRRAESTNGSSSVP
eukprot:4363430-Prymnesium_polylepis.1